MFLVLYTLYWKLVLENLKLIEKLKIQEKILEEKFKKTMDELIKANEQLAELAVKDELTKLYNYRYFRVRLDDEIERAERYGSCFALAMFDLDDFKQINDKLCHIARDRVLQFIASHLMSLNVPVVRYGGDEFILIFDKKSKEYYILARDLIKKYYKNPEDWVEIFSVK